MEREANYVAVGAFTLLVIAMTVAFLIWYRDANNAQDYRTYEIHFSGSVGGLTRGSPVRYLGVDVGQVSRISLNKSRPDMVAVVVEVSNDAPISSSTRAALQMQGVTGLLYVNLKQAEAATPGPLQQGDRYPIIQTKSSDIDALLSSLPEVVSRVGTLMDNINSLFTADNMTALSATLTNIRETTQSLPELTTRLNALLGELRTTATEISAAAHSVQGAVDDTRPELRQVMTRANETAAGLASTAQRLDRLMTSSEAHLNHFSEQGLFEVERLLRDVRSATAEFRELSRSLRETPSQLLFERPESGVEIKP